MIAKFSMPLNVLPIPLLRWVSKHLLGFGTLFGKIIPLSDIDMKKAEMPVSAKEYATMGLVIILFYFVFFYFIFFVLAFRIFNQLDFLLPFIVSAIFSFLVFIQIVAYPILHINKKVADLDRNLVFALRTILVQIRSGVSLFDSMKVVAEGNYGAVSKEFRKAVDQISTGTI
ncbi:MAG: hypothetical protein AABX02_02590, partial [archaeon]